MRLARQLLTKFDLLSSVVGEGSVIGTGGGGVRSLNGH
jgi:hypothetical protein